jgi:tetratricopeptide (TPR) repeat protein
VNEPQKRLRTRGGPIAAAILTLASVLPTADAAPEDRGAFEKRLLDELKAVSEGAAVAFQQANEARDRNDLAAARDYYAEVHRMAPDFVPATRRQCSVELSLGHRAEAVALCKQAVKSQESAESLSSLAGALSADGATADDLAEAARLTGKAMDLAPDDADAFEVACGVAMKKDDKALLHRCASRLLAIAPNAVTTQIYHTNLALAEGRPADAEAALEAAHAHGLPEVPYLALSERVRAAMPFSTRATYFIRQRGAVLGGFVGFALTGLLFWRSKKKPKESRRGQAIVPRDDTPDSQG